MAFEIVRLSFNVVLQGIFIATLCKILVMRSNAVFAVTCMALMVVSIMAQALDIPDLPRVLLLAPLTCVVLPIALSYGQFSSRVVRTLLANATMAFGEAFMANTYMLVTGTSLTTSTAEIDMNGVIVAYTLGVLTQGIINTALVYMAKRHDHHHGSLPVLPIIAFLFSSYLLVLWLQTQVSLSTHFNPWANVISLVYAVLSLVLGMAALMIAQRGARIGRESANRAASVRQERHLRAGIADSTRRMVAVRHLRHDLANQLEVIEELARHGRRDEADAHLAILQEHANLISGSTIIEAGSDE